MSSQLPLSLRWPAQQRFDAYVAGDNAVAVGLLDAAACSVEAPWVFLAGPAGCGKTHLLIAACAAANESGRSAQYLPLRRVREHAAEALRALGGSEVLALDDIEAVAGDDAAEHALFDLYNRCRVERYTMLYSSLAPPAQAGFRLPDLVSRLSACAQAVLRPLSDSGRREALRQRAQARGLVLEEAVLDFLFARAQRDLASLTALLERIDREALAAQRRVTIPFLRQLLDGTRDPSP
jgi:DnaA family protein